MRRNRDTKYIPIYGRSVLDMTVEVAFLDHNFAPPTLRRDIGILGFLHKRVFNQCHPAVARLFPFMGPCPPYHNKQIDDHMYECIRRPGMYWRSVFGLAAKYNRLRRKLWTCLQYQHLRQHSHELLGTVAHLGFPHGPSVFMHERR